MNTQALQELRKMKQLMEKGFISKEEYEKKRLEFINSQTNTTYEKKEPKKEEISMEEVQEPIKEENDPNVEISTWNGRKWVQPKMDPELEKQIFKAVLGRSVDLLKSLHESGANFNIRDKYGNTPLHYACEIGMRPVIQFLVERGAKINVANQDRKTPLHILVEKKWADVAKWLLFQGADPNMKDKDLKTPIYYANPWLAGEMKEILLQRERKKAREKTTIVVTNTNDYGEQPTILNIKSGSGDTSVEMVKESAITRDIESNEDRPEEFPVQLTNGSAKIVTIYTTYSAQKLVTVACKAFGMEEIEQNLRIAVRKGTKDDKGVLLPDEYVAPVENIDRLRYNDWPTPTSYKLVLLPLQGASQSISMRYRELMYGEKKTDWSSVEIKAPPKKPVDKYLFPKKEKKDDGNDKKKQKEEMKEFKKKQEEKKKEEKKKK